MFGFIGPNGAGKSTTIRTLLSLIRKTRGKASIFGLDCEKDREEILARVGYLPSEVFYYDNMRAIDLLEYSASFYRKDCSKRIRELAWIMELDLKMKIDDMSFGNKKKVGIVQGLLHDPELIILDEPTGGLDPLMQKKFFDLIREENRKGATVLFSSHILYEVQNICDRAAIIKEGRIITTQEIAELRKNSYKKVSYTVKEGQAAVPELSGTADVKLDGREAAFLYNGDPGDLIAMLAAVPLKNVEITEPTLEEIFMHYYE